MKKTLIIFALVIILLGCSSSQKTYTNTFSESFCKERTIIFTLNQPNSIEIEMIGPTGGQIPKRPNARRCFAKSIEKLAEETHLNMQYRELYQKSNDSEIHIEATLDRIFWIFTLSTTEMKANMKYTVPEYDLTYESSGIFKKSLGLLGEENTLIKAMKNANYLLLKEFDKNNEFK
ncbi:hypothetical protein [Flavobacterium sp.]|uniref:hypothetical protein n=1 Tax=Flavobacterium sp. TaxID=239 RepID=UPI0025FC8264|nr:hypothetical protein [Flavobacterium sp.]